MVQGRDGPDLGGGEVVLTWDPSSSCFSTDMHWFWAALRGGKVAISWKALVGVWREPGPSFLLLLVVALSVFIMRSRRRDRQGRGR